MQELESLGERLKAARLKKGLSQLQLANQIGCTSHCVIACYERGTRGKGRPDIVLLLKIAKALDVTTDYLFLGE